MVRTPVIPHQENGDEVCLCQNHHAPAPARPRRPFPGRSQRGHQWTFCLARVPLHEVDHLATALEQSSELDMPDAAHSERLHSICLWTEPTASLCSDARPILIGLPFRRGCTSPSWPPSSYSVPMDGVLSEATEGRKPLHYNKHSRQGLCRAAIRCHSRCAHCKSLKTGHKEVSWCSSLRSSTGHPHRLPQRVWSGGL